MTQRRAGAPPYGGWRRQWTERSAYIPDGGPSAEEAAQNAAPGIKVVDSEATP